METQKGRFTLDSRLLGFALLCLAFVVVLGSLSPFVLLILAAVVGCFICCILPFALGGYIMGQHTTGAEKIKRSIPITEEDAAVE